MAVENKYIDSDIVAGKLASAVAGGLAGVTAGQVTFEVAAADDDGSIYRIFKNLPPDLCVLALIVKNDAITSGTDYDIGLYSTTTSGAVITKDILVNGADFSSAATSTYVMVDPANFGKALFELAGHTVDTKKSGYDIAITANTVGSGAGTISVTALFGQGR